MGSKVTCKDLDKYLDDNKILIVDDKDIDSVFHKYSERWAYPEVSGGSCHTYPEIISTTDFAQTLNMLDLESGGQLTVIITSGLDVYNKDMRDCKSGNGATKHVMSVGHDDCYSDVYEESLPSITAIIKLLDRRSPIYCWSCGHFSVQLSSDREFITMRTVDSVIGSMKLI